MNRLHKLMEQVAADAALIASPINRRYYTGLKSSAGTLVAMKGKSVLIIDSRYFELAEKTAKVDEVILQNKLYEQIGEVLEKNGVKSVALESETVTLSLKNSLREKLPGYDFICDNTLSKAVNEQREVKDAGEIALMREAQRLTDETFAYILEYIDAGMTEKEIALEMEFYGRREGAEDAAFDFIVAAGSNTSMPHAVPSDNIVKKGEFLTMDFGFRVNGYHSDMTRTVAVGNPSDKQREVYGIVLQAHLKAIEVAKAGMSCFDVDKAARDIIDATAYKGFFGHGLGHSIGMEIHENPRFSPESKDILKVGCVMSDEPGIYIPGEFGVRIEDLIVATENGCDILTNSPKQLIIL